MSALLGRGVPAGLDEVEDALDDPELLELLLAANAHVTDYVEADTPLKTAAARGLRLQHPGDGSVQPAAKGGAAGHARDRRRHRHGDAGLP